MYLERSLFYQQIIFWMIRVAFESKNGELACCLHATQDFFEEMEELAQHPAKRKRSAERLYAEMRQIARDFPEEFSLGLEKLLDGSVRVINVKDKSEDLSSGIYVGRKSSYHFSGMEDASILGNPFVVGEKYKQGEAAALYLPYLREECRKEGEIYSLVTDLAYRVYEGEKLKLACFCAPNPCHADHIRSAIIGYARRMAVRELL